MKPISSLFLFCAILVFASCSSQKEKPWPMHQIYLADKLCNGLDPADLNKDGFLDYVTNFEDNGNIVVMLHPGLDKIKSDWPHVKIGNFPTAESACFGDVDGDGNVDAICAHGHQAKTDKSGIAVMWNPGAESVMEEGAWITSIDIPGTIEIGNFLYVRAADINGDGVLDIIAGGRAEGKVRDPIAPDTPIVGLIWCEAPANPSDRRDMSKWKVHNIDGDIISGHGFDIGDLDQDGDLDVALANNDWGLEKLEDDRKAVQWYRNPGVNVWDSAEWERNVLLVDTSFYTKPFVAVDDLNGDGLNDFVTQTSTEVLYFENEVNAPGTFNLQRITKASYVRWRARPIKIVDLNQDGKKDLVIGIIHHDGDLPKDVAALVWMEFEGDQPLADNWITHIIKWGDGFDGEHIFTGEKWDILTFTDVDRDGDTDIVVNCEEYTKINVVWFENQIESK